MIEREDENMPDRGCGKRKPGGCYLVTPLSPYGSPLEEFLVDPVHPLENIEPFRSPILVPDPSEEGLFHALVWIGEQFYPSPVDYIEETRRTGASRRVPQGFPFEKLTPGRSRMLMVHPKTHSLEIFMPENCPKQLKNHGHGSEFPCLGAHHHYVQALGSAFEEAAEGEGNGRCRIGAHVYSVPEQVGAPQDLSAGIFLQLPISEIHYIARSNDDEAPEEIASLADTWEIKVIDLPE
jgi:hypothetical protein